LFHVRGSLGRLGGQAGAGVSLSLSAGSTPSCVRSMTVASRDPYRGVSRSGHWLAILESGVLLVHTGALRDRCAPRSVGLALCLHPRGPGRPAYRLLAPSDAPVGYVRGLSIVLTCRRYRCRRYRSRRHPPRPPARKPVAAARRASRASLERTPPPTALAHSEHNVAAPTPPRAAPQQGGTRTERTSLAPRRALAALAWRGRGSARRESGARRATACGRAVP